MLDKRICGARIVDGTGRPAYVGDVGIRAGRIVLHPQEEARQVLNARGLTLTPGLIDSHSHSDRYLGLDPEVYALCKISQGITTEVVGQCGSSPFPAPRRGEGLLQGFFEAPMDEGHLAEIARFSDFSAYLDYVRAHPMPGNCAFLQGHGMLRLSVMGRENRKPTPAEMEEMKRRLHDAMEHGCLGLSSGLIYVPSVYADTEELVELCRVIRPYGGIYATHMRSESDHVVEAVREAIAIARAAGTPLFLSHHKVCGARNFGASRETLRLVEAAIADGMRVTMDQYPYAASQTGLAQCMPPKYFTRGGAAFAQRLRDPQVRRTVRAEMTEDPPKYNNSYQNAGGFGGILILNCPGTPEAEGMTIRAYAESIGREEFETYFDLMVRSGCAGSGAFFCMDEQELDAIYANPNTVVCTDGCCGSRSGPVHPRTFGSLVRALCRFSKEKGLVSFEEAVRKETLLTAQRWGLAGKGAIADGMDADLVLMDESSLADRADYLHPRRLCDGIEMVFVNGEIVYRDKKLTGARPGRAILRKT